MANNIFKNIAKKKDDFKRYTQKAVTYEWISKDEFKTLNSKLENDILTIGVIGQMKCGKSTLLNALVFGEEILPAATTPMTASLTVITYGEEKKIEAEFFNLNEWEELIYLSKRNLQEDELDENIKTKIKAAKEVIDKSYKLESEIQDLLGSTKEDHFDKLIDYVGVDGKYVAITKSVTIFMPFEYLKGVEIVDTPGFNDPIVSREERTKAFLAKADAVIMLLYAGRAFDVVDKDMIFNQLRNIGIGKLLIGVNKYDLCIENESEAEIISNVKNQLEQASKEYYTNSIAELVREKDPLLLSASMALMAKIDFGSISKDENWSFYYKKALDIFGINSQQEMFEKSLFHEFEKVLMQIILESKDEILLKKPINTIKQKGEKKHNELVSNLSQTKNRLSVLKQTDGQREELLKNLKRSEKRIKRKVDNFEIEVEEVLRKGSKDLTFKIEDLIIDYRKSCNQVIDDHGVVLREDNLEYKLESKIKDFEIKLKRLFESKNQELNLKIKKELKNFLCEIDDIAEKHDEDFEDQDYITSCKKILYADILNLTINDLLPSTGEDTSEESLWDIVFAISSGLIEGATFGIVNTAENLINGKQKARENIDYFFSILDLDKINDEIKSNGVLIIKKVKDKFIVDFLTPIIEELEEIDIKKTNRDADILKEEEKLKNLETQKAELEDQLVKMEFIK